MSPILLCSDPTALPSALSLFPGAGDGVCESDVHRPGVARMAPRDHWSASENLAPSGSFMPFD